MPTRSRRPSTSSFSTSRRSPHGGSTATRSSDSIAGSRRRSISTSCDHRHAGRARDRRRRIRRIEYAVKMRQFDQDALLSACSRATTSPPAHRRAGRRGRGVSQHRRTERRADAPYGSSGDILRRRSRTSRSCEAAARRRTTGRELRTLLGLDGARRTRARAGVRQRARRDGFVRECHGDLHLGNIALVDGAVTLFDCIEFNPSMRWIDVMSDVAFSRDGSCAIAADPALAARFLTAYLEATGDYDGLDGPALLSRLPRDGPREGRVPPDRADDRCRRARAAHRRSTRTYLDLADRRDERRAHPGRHHPRRDRLGQDHPRAGARRVLGRRPHPFRRRTQTAHRARRRRTQRDLRSAAGCTRATRAGRPTCGSPP